MRNSYDFTPIDKKRAILVKNAYLGLEKVENCHKVKACRMKDQSDLRRLMKQYERDKLNLIINTFQKQQFLHHKLGALKVQTDFKLATVSGDKKEAKQLKAIKGQTASDLAGPSRIEDQIFNEILCTKRDTLLEMRKPENYDLRLIKKSFWEKDEEFYSSFEGTIRNPFEMLDNLMQEFNDTNTEGSGTRLKGRKSLSCLTKVLLSRKDSSTPTVALTRRPTTSNSRELLLSHHKEMTKEENKELEVKLSSLCDSMDKFRHRESDMDDRIKWALERCEKSSRQIEEDHLPYISSNMCLNVSKDAKEEWKRIVPASHISSLTWKPVHMPQHDIYSETLE